MNKAVEKHLADPYNRLRYLYDFLDRDEYGYEDDISQKCYPRIYHYLSTVTDSEAHYWWKPQPQLIQFKLHNREDLHRF